MASRYRKKPVVIEAFQITRERRASNMDWPDWLNEAWQIGPREGGVWCVDYPNSDGTDKLAVGSLQGVNLVDWGDWIIRNGDGDLYACKPDIFAATYEEVSDGER